MGGINFRWLAVWVPSPDGSVACWSYATFVRRLGEDAAHGVASTYCRYWNVGHSFFTPRGTVVGAVTRLWATPTRYSLSTPTGARDLLLLRIVFVDSYRGKRLIPSPNRLTLGLSQRIIQGIRGGGYFPRSKAAGV